MYLYSIIVLYNSYNNCYILTMMAGHFLKKLLIGNIVTCICHKLAESSVTRFFRAFWDIFPPTISYQKKLPRRFLSLYPLWCNEMERFHPPTKKKTPPLFSTSPSFRSMNSDKVVLEGIIIIIIIILPTSTHTHTHIHIRILRRPVV